MKITKKVFRILKDVKIIYKNSSNLDDGFCVITPSVRKATIYPCPEDIDPNIYRIHELLHVALKKLGTYKDDSKRNDEEEILIQDIVDLITRAPTIK